MKFWWVTNDIKGKEPHLVHELLQKLIYTYIVDVGEDVLEDKLLEEPHLGQLQAQAAT